ncbi:armadillo repeat-containing protein 12 isoform X2 [Sceloporus undulatus]|uniref:armadillo repeat-containing protein 12 isoform X2 n=1 Tax=Sceloporus undulatus TaxID=8520 RepID=UPI001C4A944A|nr:armadillo repeat-containing protein 12 isoform X2 [Sceloporus undulatus]
MKYLELVTTKNVVSAATGVGAAFLIAKTILAGINSPPFNPEPLTLAKLAIVHQSKSVTDSRELKELLLSLNPRLDDYSKNMILHGITRCVYLLDTEASACTYDDIKLVASFLDDPDVGIKIQTLHALKAFTGIWKFRIRIQEFIPKVLEIIADIWDSDVHVAGLRLLNGLQLPDHTLGLLRKLMPAIMEILQMGNTLAQVQVLKFLSMLAQKESLLFDIMNCQVHPEFFNLFQTSRPGNLLFELLVFVERLCEGRLTPHYQSVHWQYNELSLHEVLFGEDSHLADCLLSLIIHPEEEVQIQACRVILKLQLNEEGEIVGIHGTDSNFSTFSDCSVDGSIVKAIH